MIFFVDFLCAFGEFLTKKILPHQRAATIIFKKNPPLYYEHFLKSLLILLTLRFIQVYCKTKVKVHVYLRVCSS